MTRAELAAAMTSGAPGSVEIRASGGGVLGALDAHTGNFPGPANVTVDFLLNHRGTEAVGRHDTSAAAEASGAAGGTPILCTLVFSVV